VKHYWLRLFPEQPVHLRDERVIPAAALRGAIASILLGTCMPGHQHDTGPCSAACRYWSFFGERTAVRIGAAYAGTGDETRAFPATARTCSQSPGFKVVGGHGAFDVAIRQWTFEEACAEPGRLLAPFSLRCPVCDAALVPCKGNFTLHGERDLTLVDDIAVPATTVHASIGRTRRQIIERYQADGRLANRGVYYTSRIDVPERLDGLLHEAVSGGLWIGGRRTRGMGAMRAELAPRPPDTPLEDRIARFNRAVRAERRFYAATAPDSTPADEGEWYFTLDMAAPVLPAYSSVPSIRPAPLVLPEVKVARQWLSAEAVGGWHQAAGLPRRTQLGTRGVVLYRVPPEANRAAAEELLNFVEAEGIGTGRERGYSTATICDPFHLYVDPL
jgi:CRISPR-associated Csx10 family RAMP protein